MKTNLSLFLACIICASYYTASAQTIDRGIATTNGIVNTTLQNGNTLYVGGSFTQVGLGFKKLARYSTGNIKPDVNFPQADGTIYAVEPDGNGGYYLGGQIKNFNGKDLTNNGLSYGVIVLHINADYSLDTNFALARDDYGGGYVTSMKKQGNSLYIGGYFYNIGNTSRPYLAALDPVSGTLINWTPAIDVNTESIYGNIDANDSLVFVTGAFDYYNGVYYGNNYKTLKAFRADNGQGISNYPAATYTGTTNTIKIKNNKLYESNYYYNNQFGQRVYGAAKNNINTSDVDVSFPLVDGYVSAILPDGSGGYYIGGDIYHVGTVAVNNLAHVLANGTVDPAFTANVNSHIDCFASDGTNLYIGGSFSQVNSTARTNAAAVSLTTGALTTWNPAPNDEVLTMVYSGGTIYMGGSFTNVKATTRNYAAAVTTANNLTAWNPNCSAQVQQIVSNSTGSSFFICGSFSTVKSASRPYLARVNNTDGAPASWTPNPSSVVDDIALNGNILYAGGPFNTINGVPKQYLAAIDTASNNPTSFQADLNGVTLGLLISSNKLYLAGQFTQIQNVSRNYAARIDLSTGNVDSWDPSFNAYALTIAGSGNDIITGGTFSLANVVTRNLIAAIDINSKQVTSFNPNITSIIGTVSSMIFNGNELYAGGNFSYNDGGAYNKNCLVVLDTATGNVSRTFDKYPNTTVNAISLFGNKLAVGGYFTGFSNPNGTGLVTRNYLASYDLNANTLTSDVYDPNNYVRILQSDVNSGLIAAGDFTLTNYAARNYIAAIDLSTGLPTAFNPVLNGYVNALALKDTTLFLGGNFSTINNPTRLFVGAVNTNTGATTPWAANANSTVYTLAIQDTTLYIGGNFTNIKSTPRNRAAAVTTGAATVLAWNPNLNNYPNTLLVNGSNIYLGGVFTTVGGTARNYLAKVDNINGTLASWNPSPNNYIYGLAKDANALYVGGSFSNIASKNIYSVAKFSLAADTIFTAFDPKVRTGTSAATVNSISLYGNTLFTGSSNITKVNTVNKGYLVGIDVVKDSATAFDPRPDANVSHVNAGTNKLFTGGNWSLIDGKLSPSYFATFNLEPLSPATSLTFTNLQPTSVTANWTNGSGEGRLVTTKQGSAANAPADGNGYNANAAFGQGSNIGGSYAVYKNSGSNVNVTSLLPNHTYYVGVYEYNGNGTATEYLQSPALTGSVTTPCPTYTNIVTASGPLTFCNGDSVTLTALANMTTYSWSNGATARSIVVKTAGSYTVNITDSNACGGTSSPSVVTVNPKPTPAITSTDTLTNVCPGKTVTLDAGAGYSSYLWSNGATTQTIIVSAAGNYSVTVTNSYGCSGTSAAKSVTYQSCGKPTNPVVSNITATSAKLSWTGVASCSIGYQARYRKTATTAWTTFIVTTTTKTITGLTANTTYEWQVQTGCNASPLIASGFVPGPNFTTAASADAPVASVDLKTNNTSFNAIAFPNPAHSSATLQLSGSIKDATITITDIAGKQLWQLQHVSDAQVALPIEKFVPGVYMIKVSNGTETRLIKLVKE